MKFQTNTEYVNGIPFHTTHLITNNKTIGAMILFPEAFGLSGHIKDVACRFAAMGFKVYTFPIYLQFNQNVLFSIEPKEKTIRLDLINKMDIDFYKQVFHKISPYFDKYSTLFSIGFSLGGYFSILSSNYINYKKLVALYPNPTTNNKNHPNFENIDLFLYRMPKSLMFFGLRDHSIPKEEIDSFRKDNIKVVSFEDCQHGYFCNSRHTYSKEAAKETFNLIKEFLSNE